MSGNFNVGSNKRHFRRQLKNATKHQSNITIPHNDCVCDALNSQLSQSLTFTVKSNFVLLRAYFHYQHNPDHTWTSTEWSLQKQAQNKAYRTRSVHLSWSSESHNHHPTLKKERDWENVRGWKNERPGCRNSSKHAFVYKTKQTIFLCQVALTVGLTVIFTRKFPLYVTC